MKKVFLLLLVCVSLLNSSVKGQAVRYLDTVFTSVKVDSNVVYGSNFTIMGIIAQQTTRTVRQPLTCNVHTPVGDTEAARPVALIFHSGNFLPKAITTSYSGTKEDSVVSTICRQLAHRGYVAASCTYRIGWNPADPSQDGRTNFLINAAYRGIQDARTAIRYFKANAATWKVDTNKIMLIGVGTGGYITLGTASFDAYGKVVTTQYPANKFIDNRNGLPMVIEQAPGFGYVNGDVEAKVVGRVPPGGSGVPPALDTLCAPNHVTPSSKFQFCVNLGGAIGDLNWLDANTPPILSFQAPYDQNAPYIDETLRVPVAPGVSLPIVRVQGASLIQRKMDTLGRNNVFKGKVIAKYDPYKSIFDTRNGGSVNGLYPILGDTISDSSPWDFTGSADLYANSIYVSAPRSSRARALRYIDTIMKVMTPRACLALNLPCKGPVTSTEDLLNANTTKLTIAPNPAQNYITFESEVYNPMHAIELYDMSGRLVRQVAKVDNHQFNMMRGSLPTGMYIAKVRFEGGILSKKVVFEDR
ncbi:MAG: T9SS type A sorting domain-containing protein [Saprospiraceae bacterium]|nr:T9SS type A sorting domain-containing protein [Saprospiraceae bacterium]